MGCRGQRQIKSAVMTAEERGNQLKDASVCERERERGQREEEREGVGRKGVRGRFPRSINN